MTKNSKRLFIAINIPEHIRNELASINESLQHPYLRWTPQQNLHVTVHFIGESRIDELPEFQEIIFKISSYTAPFTLVLEELTVIRKNRNPVMIWARLRDNESFTNLALQLQKSLPGDNTKKPIPHITLARIKKGKEIQLPGLPAISKSSIEVGNIELMESTTKSPFPFYKAIQRFELRK